MVGASGWCDSALALDFPGLRTCWRCRFHLGRRIASDAKSLYHRTAWSRRYLDERECVLLPARPYDVLDSSSFCRAKSPALSHPQRHISRRIGAAALACPRSIARARCLAGRSNLGVASGAGAIGRVGHRNEEHAVGLLLPACYFLLFAITRSQTKFYLLLADDLLFRRRNYEQTFHRNAAAGAGALSVVARKRNQAARPAFIAPFRSNFAAGERMDNLGTEISLPRYRSGLGADASSARSYFSRCNLVLSTQAHLATSAHFHLPALER